MASTALKGILKPPSSSHTDRASIRSPEEARQIAVAHALLLEQQKEVEAEIFRAIEILASPDFPSSSPNSSASCPPPPDAQQFKSLLRPFQPSDYDDLIEERNILMKCGYALCPNKRRHRPNGGKFTLVNKNRADFGIVETKEVEKWCSDRCARRALYVKVQLSETAAWERIGMPGIKIDLMDEPEEERKTITGAGDVVTQLERDIAHLKIGEDAKALDAERVGNAGTKKMELTIREKDVTAPAKPPLAGKGGDGHLGVEGHKSGFGAATTHVQRRVMPKEDASSDDDNDGDDGDIIYGGVKMSGVTISEEHGGGMKITSTAQPEKSDKAASVAKKPKGRQRIDDEDEIWRQLDAIRAQQSGQQ